MCHAVTCRRCGRPTWRGCGAHVEQVLGHVPPEQRCRCGEDAAVDPPQQRFSLGRLLRR